MKASDARRHSPEKLEVLRERRSAMRREGFRSVELAQALGVVRGTVFDVLPALKDGDSFDRLRKGGQRAVPADGPEAPCKGTATSRLTVQAMRSF